MIIDHNNLLLITDPSNELLDLSFRSYNSKIISGLPNKPLHSKMLILFAKYESNLLKQRMINKRKYCEIESLLFCLVFIILLGVQLCIVQFDNRIFQIFHLFDFEQIVMRNHFLERLFYIFHRNFITVIL